MVVLTHGASREALPLIGSLLEEGIDPSTIAVVHNPVGAGESALEPPDPRVTVIRPEHNLGYARGMNRGIAHHRARGARLLLLLTHDVRLRPGAVDALVQAAADNPGYGILGPVLRFRDDQDRVFSFGGVSERGGATRHMTADPRPGTAEALIDCHWVDGAAMLVRAEVLDQVGLLDERFFGYFEESELCLRATRAGWRVGAVRAAVAAQSEGKTTWPGSHAYLMRRNGLEYARLAAGPAGVVAGLGRTLHVTAVEARRALGALAGRRPPEVGLASRLRLAGNWIGVLDFLRRRFGPPPPYLPGIGDYRHTGGRSRRRTLGRR